MEALARRIRRHLHAPLHSWFAPCAPGLAGVLADELAALGASELRPEEGGVGFRGKLELMYRAQLYLATANRIWLRLEPVGARRPEELFRHLSRLPWELYLAPEVPLRFTVHAAASWLHHDELIEGTVRDAIARRLTDQGRPATGARAVGLPEQEAAGEAVQRVLVRLVADRAELSLDASGAHLHRRGYRLDPSKAPLRETLAAGALRLAGYDGTAPLVDPMCGGGTFAIEGALLATHRAPGAGRRFLFERWPSFREATWRHLVERELAGRIPAPAPILARDRDLGMVRAATANAERAELAQVLRVEAGDFFADPPGLARGWVLLNPPYGLRLEPDRAMTSLYERIGARLRAAYPGWRYGIMVPSPELVAALGLPVSTRVRLPHGGLAVELVAGTVPG